MRAILSLSAAVFIASVAPASAMCGGGQQAGAAAQSGMCARPSASSQAEDPFGIKPSQPQQQQSGMGMCPCCKGMAMMGGGMKMDSADPHKGMDMSPKQ